MRVLAILLVVLFVLSGCTSRRHYNDNSDRHERSSGDHRESRNNDHHDNGDHEE